MSSDPDQSVEPADKDSSLDDVLANIGLASPDEELDPETMFFHEYAIGKFPKIDNARYWLQHELGVYTSLVQYSHMHIYQISPMKLVELPHLARELMRHYFYMYHLPRFEHNLEGAPKCDIDKFLDKVMEYEPIMKTIKKAQSDLDNQ